MKHDPTVIAGWKEFSRRRAAGEFNTLEDDEIASTLEKFYGKKLI